MLNPKSKSFFDKGFLKGRCSVGAGGERASKSGVRLTAVFIKYLFARTYQQNLCPSLVREKREREEEKNFKNDAAEKTFGMIVKVEKDSRNFATTYCSANSIDAFCSFHKTRQPKGHNL